MPRFRGLEFPDFTFSMPRICKPRIAALRLCGETILLNQKGRPACPIAHPKGGKLNPIARDPIERPTPERSVPTSAQEAGVDFDSAGFFQESSVADDFARGAFPWELETPGLDFLSQPFYAIDQTTFALGLL
jgi:hypothetical protein